MKSLFLIIFAITILPVFSQKTGFISSETIRNKFPDASQAEQRVQSIVDSWKRESEGIQKKIDALDFEIRKNRLIWTDGEKLEKDIELEKLRKQKADFATQKYEPGGEYDRTVQLIMQPIETKIFAIVQEVSAEEGYDLVIDQSTTTLPYVNAKYDLTVKCLRKLGVDVDLLEKDLKDRIDKDPRNKEKEAKTPSSSGRRTTSRTDNSKKSGSDAQIEPSDKNKEVSKEQPKETPKTDSLPHNSIKK